MSESQTRTNWKKGGIGKGALIVVLLIVVVVLIGVIIYITRAKEEVKRNVVVTPDNVEEVIDSMSTEEYTAPGYYETSMTTTWNFEDGEATSEDAYVENVANNSNDVYFDLVLAEDNDHVILSSPVIPRGSSLSDISLDEDLNAGTYDCVMIYHLVDGEQNTVSTLRVGVTVVVKND